MRCLACNVALTDYEATRKFSWGECVDLCNKCYGESGMNDTLTREELDGADDNGTTDSLP